MQLRLVTCCIADPRQKRALSVAMYDHRRGFRTCRTGTFIVTDPRYAYADRMPSVKQVPTIYTTVSAYITVLTVRRVENSAFSSDQVQKYDVCPR